MGDKTMCTQKDIDNVLKQLQGCRDTAHMRRLLEEAMPCNESPEVLQTDGEQEHGCSCRLHFWTELQNIIYTIQTK